MAFFSPILRRRKVIEQFQHHHQQYRWISSTSSPVISHEILAAGAASSSEHEPPKTAVFIHGLMGAGKNLRSLAKNLLDTVTHRSPPNSPGWQLALVDLRNHGNSANLAHLRPPHNIESAAMDIMQLVESKLSKWPDVVIGHSLGGKVALEFGKSCASGRFGSKAIVPKQVWVLDTVPGKVGIEQKGDVEKVLNFIMKLPDPAPSRRWFVEQLVNAGFSKSLADWLASNLRRVDSSSEQMTWIFDLKGILDMYQSYKESCYWSLLESPPKEMEIGVVRAENSDRWYPESVSRLEQLAQANSSPKPDVGTVSYHILGNAGHWLHVDNPNGLVEILAPFLVKLAAW